MMARYRAAGRCIAALVGLGAGALATAYAGGLPVAPHSIALPSSSRVFPGDGPGAQAANGFCLMCHSYGMVATQPALDKGQWVAEIAKMKDDFKAPIPDAEVQLLASYLADLQAAR